MVRVFSAVMLTGWLATAELALLDIPLTGENTTVTFIGTKPGGEHKGGFKKLTGTAKFEPADATTLKLSVEIDMTTTYTDNEQLTSHLKSPDFFGVKNNPKSKFVSTKVEKSGDGYTVTGNLTLNGRTKTLSFPAKIEPAADGLNLTSNLSINRNDWGITFGKGKIDDQVKLKIEVRAKK
jgi:polyisoprenoid-binding protein YceI